MARLPEFVPPMLARIGKPFDSPDHLFEVKWDGTRALTMSESDGFRLRSRKQKDLVPGYPELKCLEVLPAGVLLDGEIVVLEDGRPSFRGLLTREQARNPESAMRLAQRLPATYVVFDLLYQDHRSVMDRP